MPPLIQIPIALLVVVAGLYDIRSRRIPNWLALPAVPIGFALNAFIFAQPPHYSAAAGLGQAALGFGLAVLIYMPLYAVRGMGAGDVKLAMAVGALAGWAEWLRIMFFSAIVGLILALIVMALNQRFGKTLKNTAYIFWDLINFRAPFQRTEEVDLDSGRGYTLPHGAVIALGTLTLIGVRVFVGG
jgi:prepilin peptidase CpaA